MNPPSSQITGHLNKAPIKIQCLSLLIGVGSDRQPECQCLFWFHPGPCLSNASAKPGKDHTGHLGGSESSGNPVHSSAGGACSFSENRNGKIRLATRFYSSSETGQIWEHCSEGDETSTVASYSESWGVDTLSLIHISEPTRLS